MDQPRVRLPGAAFLLSQLGGLSSRLWHERLSRVGLEPREVMLFRHVALNQGRSQREVAEAVGLPATRIVRLVDGLEARGWIARTPGAADRRTNALQLTAEGEAALQQIIGLGSEHEADLTRGLDPDERSELVRILSKVAAGHGLIEGVHPGFDDSRADQTRA